MVVNIKKIHPEAIIPQYQTRGAVGFDFHAVETMEIPSKEQRIISTGLAFEIPEGFEMQIRSRSGLAAKCCVFVLNSPGTIDSDYRGEIKVILENLSPVAFLVKKGDRIAQGVVQAVPKIEFSEVNELSETERGEGGFGSTNEKKV